jgi:DNA (cytosine-5)-methyltransferase 1
MNALDLYCSAGGASLGLMQAGFHVTGVDIKPQPRYCGDAFIQADALQYLATADLSQFDFIHASPPCKRHTVLKTAPHAKGDAHPDLITPTRPLLIRSRLPWVIENVVGAQKHLRSPITLCGSMFGLRAPSGELRRHRLFETSFPLTAPSKCRHGKPTIGVYGAHNRNRQRDAGLNHRSGSNLPWEHGFIAMGVPVGSMTLAELSEAIPPAYSHFVAQAVIARMRSGCSPAEAIE